MSQRVLIGGGSGLIGTHLTALLEEEGYEVRWLSRNPDRYEQQTFFWDPSKDRIDPAALEGVDIVIQLAGADIAEKRWTDKRKRILRDSRLDSHQTMLNAIEKSDQQPDLYIAPSAIGYYGDRGDELLTEDSEPGKGFLPKLCQEWEEASNRAADLGMRLVQFRIGLVLSTDGGMLAELVPYFNWGFGTVFGSGEQYYSWIHIDDLSRMFIHAIEYRDFSGLFNAVGPNPVPNERFARTLRSSMQQPGILIPAPAMALRFMLGEMANALLDSDRVSCEKIREEGFTFRYDELHRALEDLLR